MNPEIRIPERDKKPGVCYAVTDEGLELPVVDVTHPAFRVDPTREEIERRVQAFRETRRRLDRQPLLVRKAMWWTLRRRSRLTDGLMRAGGGVLDSLTTYLMKLGSENLGSGYATSADRRVAETLAPFNTRLRLQAMARMEADALVPALAAGAPGAPIHLVNIAGGPASDSFNALIIVHKEHPGLIGSRPVRIHVLDPDAAGPSFGRRAVVALTAPGGPLAGVDAGLERVDYDWAKPAPLAALLTEVGPGAVVVASSEGGLFEYAEDGVIAGNLAALAAGAPGAPLCVSMTRRTKPGAESNSMVGLASVPRSWEQFEGLLGRSRWTAEAVLKTPLSYAMRLRPL